MNIKKIRITFLVIGSILLAKNALAAPQETDKASSTPDVQNSVSTYSELDSLRSKNAILTEQLKIAELLNKINTAKGVQSTPVSLGFPSKAKQSSTYIDRGARVELVAGVGDKLAATIQLSDGGNAIARVGMRIPNLGIVKAIKTDEVIVQNGKETFSVPFASESTPTTSPYATPYSPAPQGGLVVPPISQTMGTN